MVTGESKPVPKKKNDEVIGGSVNGEGALKVEIQKTGDDIFLSKVIVMVREAQESKSRTQTVADKAAFWLTLVAIFSGAITMFAWLVIMNSSFIYALSRTVTVLVITCPLAGSGHSAGYCRIHCPFRTEGTPNQKPFRF